ncbi:hypothetical protein MKX03_032640, partial [Papaver bracteatum]
MPELRSGARRGRPVKPKIKQEVEEEKVIVEPRRRSRRTPAATATDKKNKQVVIDDNNVDDNKSKILIVQKQETAAASEDEEYKFVEEEEDLKVEKQEEEEKMDSGDACKSKSADKGVDDEGSTPPIPEKVTVGGSPMYKIEKKLGKGGFGQVYVGRRVSGGSGTSGPTAVE